MAEFNPNLPLPTPQADPGFERVKRNVQKMISASAPEADIDGYLASEGFTPDQFKKSIEIMRPGPTKTAAAEASQRYWDSLKGADKGTVFEQRPILDPAAREPFQVPDDSLARNISGVGQRLANVLTLNAANELVAGVKALDPTKEIVPTFQQSLQGIEQTGRNFEVNSPNLAIGADIAGIVGNPLNVLGAEFVTGARSLGGQAARGMASGAAAGATGGFFGTDGSLEDRSLGAAYGGGIGAGIGTALPVLGRMGAPQVSPEVQMLMSKGITPTPGQMLGQTASKIEERLASLPIAGDMISAGRRRAQEQFNLAVANDVLAPIGQKTTANAGRELIADVEKKIGDEYTRVLQNVTFVEDQQLIQDVTALRNLAAATLPDTEAKRFESIIADIGKKVQNGQMSGEQFKVVESELGQLARRYGKDQSAYVKELGDVVSDLQQALRDSLPRTNPMQAQPLQNANAAWAKFKRLQRAASYVGSKDGEPGVFSADQFQSAVKAMDSSKDKGAFARGTANMQDVSDAAKNVLGSRVPNSGTPERMAAMIAGIGGAGFIEPTTLAATGLLTLPYLPPVQRAIAAGLAKRPQWMQQMFSRVPDLAIPFGIGGGQAGAAIATPPQAR